MCSPCSDAGPASRTAPTSSWVSDEQPLSTNRAMPTVPAGSPDEGSQPHAWGVADPRTSLSLNDHGYLGHIIGITPGDGVGRPRPGRCRGLGSACEQSLRAPPDRPGRRSGLPRRRVVGAAAPRRPRGPAGRARPGVRRPPPPPRTRPVGPDPARQRPRGGRRQPGRAPRRGDLHRVGHRRRPPRAARAARRPRRAGPRWSTPPSSTPPCCTPRPGPAGRASSVPVDRLGRVDVPGCRRASAPGVAVVAVQSANHEVGTLQPLAEVVAALPDVPLFVDACASAGPPPAPPRLGGGGRLAPTSGAGRRGSACCWSARAPAGATRSPATTGSTSAPPASRTCRPRWPPRRRCRPSSPSATRSRRARRRSSTGSGARGGQLPDVEVVGDPDDRLPHLVTFSCLYVDGEALVTGLDRRGYGVASGSACTASTLQPSHVLAAMGVLTHGNVRLSLTRDTTEDDVDGFLGRCPRSCRSIRGGGLVGRGPLGAPPRVGGAPRACEPTVTSSSTAAGCSARCRSSSWAAVTWRRCRSAGRRGGRRRRGRAVDVPAWCRMRGRSTSARTPPTTARRYLVRRGRAGQPRWAQRLRGAARPRRRPRRRRTPRRGPGTARR